MKTRCHWCNKIYATAGAYSNHLHKVHPDRLHYSLPRLKRRSTDEFQQGPDTTQDSNAFDIEAAPSHPSDIEEVDHSDVDAVELSDIDELDFAEIHAEYPDSPECAGIDEDSDTDTEQTSSSLETPDVSVYTPEAGRCRNLASYKAGRPVRDFPFSKERSKEFNHLYPFLTPRDYNLAKFFTTSKVPKRHVTGFFKAKILTPTGGNPPSDISFGSGHTFYTQTRKMVEDPSWESGMVEYPLRPKSEFFYRNILDCIQYLLHQRAFVKHMLWEPVELFNRDGDRIYSEMNTGSWWWDQQVTPPYYIPDIACLQFPDDDSSRVYTNPRPPGIRSDTSHKLLRG
jgi:hypothetical protein